MDYLIKISKRDISYITKAIEGMGHLAMVTTLDRQEGLIRICFSIDQVEEIHKLLDALKMPLTIVSRSL